MGAPVRDLEAMAIPTEPMATTSSRTSRSNSIASRWSWNFGGRRAPPAANLFTEARTWLLAVAAATFDVTPEIPTPLIPSASDRGGAGSTASSPARRAPAGYHADPVERVEPGRLRGDALRSRRMRLPAPLRTLSLSRARGSLPHLSGALHSHPHDVCELTRFGEPRLQVVLFDRMRHVVSDVSTEVSIARHLVTTDRPDAEVASRRAIHGAA